jgi:hypothetical protein
VVTCACKARHGNWNSITLTLWNWGGGTWFEPLLSMAFSKNNYYLNSIITWSICKCKCNWKQRPALPLPLFVRQTALTLPWPPCPALPCPCPTSLNRQASHFLRPETKRYGFFLGYGFQYLDRQTDIVTLIYKTSGCPWPKATLELPVWNPGPKIEIPHPENHVLKVFKFRSWKPRVWKSRPQSWDPKSWKPYPKISQAQSWDPKSWKACPENHILRMSPTHGLYLS